MKEQNAFCLGITVLPNSRNNFVGKLTFASSFQASVLILVLVKRQQIVLTFTAVYAAWSVSWDSASVAWIPLVLNKSSDQTGAGSVTVSPIWCPVATYMMATTMSTQVWVLAYGGWKTSNNGQNQPWWLCFSLCVLICPEKWLSKV